MVVKSINLYNFSGGQFDTQFEHLKVCIPFDLVIAFPETYFGDLEMYIKRIFIRTLFGMDKIEENKFKYQQRLGKIMMWLSFNGTICRRTEL